MTNLTITGELNVGKTKLTPSGATFGGDTSLSNVTAGSMTSTGNVTAGNVNASNVTINNNLAVNGDTRVARGIDGKYWNLSPHDNGTYSKYLMIKRDDVLGNCAVLIHQDDSSDCLKNGSACRHVDLNIERSGC